MKFLVTILLTLLIGSLGVASSTPVKQIQGIDVVTEKKFELTFPTLRPVAVVFLSARCPCSASHEELLKEFHEKFSGVQLIGVHSNADEDKMETQEHFKKSALPFPVIQDEKNFYANLWGALKTPHSYVFDKEGQILYQGGVTDSHVGPSAKKQYLREVFEDLQAGKSPRHKEGRALGCYIAREKK